MTDLTHLFKIGQKVKIKNEQDFTNKVYFDDGEIIETYPDHIIVKNIKYDVNGWYEEGFNIGEIYPDYNF